MVIKAAPELLSIAAEPTTIYEKQPLVVAIPERNQPFAKRVLGGKIVSLFKDDPHFTHIKFQKLQFLAEQVMGANLRWNYYFQSAGPYDPPFMHNVADKLKESGWYEERNFKFYPLGKEAKIEDYYNGYFGTAMEKMNSLFSVLANTTEAETEIIATVYAVWNNRIIQQQAISDTALIEDFYNWSERKAAYTSEQILWAV